MPRGIRLLWLGPLALVVFVAIVIAIPQLRDDESPGPEVGVTFLEIKDAPESFLGKEVTVSAEIARVLGPRAFTIGAADAGGGDLLVLELAEAPSGLESGDEVRVTGTVELFDVDRLPSDGDYPADVFGAFSRRPSIMATDVSSI